MNKRIVIGAHFHWHSFLHIGSHQYAKQFAKNGYKVAYLSESISPLHCIFAKDRTILKEKCRSWYKGGEWVEEGKIWAYVPFTLLPIQYRLFLRNRWTIRNNHRLTLPSINYMLRKKDFKQADIIFLDEAFDYLLDLVNHKKSILRIHDDINHLFNKGNENYLENAKKVIQRVDLVIVVSRVLESMIKEMGAKRVLYLPNAVDFEHSSLGPDTLPTEFSDIPSPRVIYVGSISNWFDVDLMAYTASKLPNISFIMIGKPMIDFTKLQSLPNVYMLGIRNHDMLPQYFKNVDIGIIPWKRGQFTDYAHPNKLYEYMACGLPVVSTKWEELEYIKSPAYLASNYEEFAEKIRIALGVKEKNKYIEFAKANSWENRFEQLMKDIYPN